MSAGAGLFSRSAFSTPPSSGACTYRHGQGSSSARLSRPARRQIFIHLNIEHGVVISILGRESEPGGRWPWRRSGLSLTGAFRPSHEGANTSRAQASETASSTASASNL